jgi:hypothetical protein
MHRNAVKCPFAGMILNEFQVYRYKAGMELQKNKDQTNPSSLHYQLLCTVLAESCLLIKAQHDLTRHVERYYSMIE